MKKTINEIKYVTGKRAKLNALTLHKLIPKPEEDTDFLHFENSI